MSPVRIPVSEAPKVDGYLTDPVWRRAAVISHFTTIGPTSGNKPSEPTKVFLLYDKYALYIGIHCYDDPSKIIVTDKKHDGFEPSGDFVRINLDPLLTRKNGYAFEINPLGGYGDGILQYNTDFLIHWNLVWRAKAHIVRDGWTAELEIPFREINYDPHQSTWGFDVIRQIKRFSETDGWAPSASSIGFNDLSVAGNLTGMHRLSEGHGLDIQVYGIGKVIHTNGAQGHTATTFKPSADLFYKITPSLTATLAYNPDFSAAPLEPRKLNTTRFALFYPEVRQFFLQDAAQFKFGGLSFEPHQGGGGPSRQTTDTNGEPFFSGTIGLINGQNVGLLGGAKLSGNIARAQVGALVVRTNPGFGVRAQTLSVVRTNVPVGADTSVGFIGTDGDPTGLSRNHLVGGDFSYLNPDFLPGKQFRASAFYERSNSSLVGSDSAYGASINLPNDPWSGDVDFKQIGTEFAPALGFANRTGIRQWTGQVNRRFHLVGSPLAWYETGASGFYITGLDGTLQSRLGSVWVDGFSRAGDELDVHGINELENIPAPFLLAGKLPVPAGHYDWTYLHAFYRGSLARPFTVDFGFNCCSIFGGRYLGTDVTLDYRPNGTYEFHIEDNRAQFHLPSGSATVHAVNASVTVNLTPDMNLTTQAEYDNITHHLDVLAIYNWQYSPGQTVLVSVGNDALTTGGLFVPRYVQRSFTVLLRIGHTFQF